MNVYQKQTDHSKRAPGKRGSLPRHTKVYFGANGLLVNGTLLTCNICKFSKFLMHIQKNPQVILLQLSINQSRSCLSWGELCGHTHSKQRHLERVVKNRGDHWRQHVHAWSPGLSLQDTEETFLTSVIKSTFWILARIDTHSYIIFIINMLIYLKIGEGRAEMQYF